MNNPKAMETEDLSFMYPGGFLALEKVNFHAERGEFIALLASNGSGKTTLLKNLAGLLKPQKGKIRMEGKDLAQYSQAELYQKLGLVFQNPNDQLFAATVGEDVAFGPRNLGMDEILVQERVDSVLQTLSVAILKNRAIHHLSFGEQKRVAIAGVLAMKPSILILDEPTAGLDPAGEAAILRFLKQLNHEQGITIILATHSVDMLPLFANRIYLLNQGKVLKEGPAEEIFLDQEMIDRASLRIPHVSNLLDELKRLDGVPIHGMPLTIGEARKQLLKLIPDHLVSHRNGKGAT